MSEKIPRLKTNENEVVIIDDSDPLQIEWLNAFQDVKEERLRYWKEEGHKKVKVIRLEDIKYKGN